MFKKIYLDPENKTFAEIMGNGKDYNIPPFQRDYSWQEEQRDELWLDVEIMFEKETQHFMGYLVLQSEDGKSFQIIDGQQRLTTITLMITAVLSRFWQLVNDDQSAQENEQRLEHYHDTYLGVFDALTLETSKKLTLNLNNKSHFTDMTTVPYQVPKHRNIIASNRLLNKTFEFFQKKIANYSSKKLVKLVEGLADGLLFTTITVQNDLNAYLVFETLNARGVHLSAPDLLKNYLWSVMAEKFDPTNEIFQQCNEDWARVLEQLGATNFTEFLRSYHGMFDKLTPKKDLYRMLKRKITQAEEVVPYLRDIRRHAATYTALQNPDDSFWTEYDDGAYTACIDDLRTLKLFNIKTPLSLLMAAYTKFSSQDFVKTVCWIAIVSIRYNVICNKSPNSQENIYNNLANQIAKKDLTLSALKDGLMPVYPEDKEFANAFSTKTMPSRQSAKKIVYLLQQIERHCSDGQEPSPNLTLEHVLPYHPDNDWQESFGVGTYNQAIDRLGNTALLPESKNQEIAGGTFDQKKEALQKSGYSINRKIAENKTWDIDNLNSYQSWLAKQAQTVWRIG